MRVEVANPGMEMITGFGRNAVNFEYEGKKVGHFLQEGENYQARLVAYEVFRVYFPGEERKKVAKPIKSQVKKATSNAKSSNIKSKSPQKSEISRENKNFEEAHT